MSPHKSSVALPPDYYKLNKQLWTCGGNGPSYFMMILGLNNGPFLTLCGRTEVAISDEAKKSHGFLVNN